MNTDYLTANPLSPAEQSAATAFLNRLDTHLAGEIASATGAIADELRKRQRVAASVREHLKSERANRWHLPAWLFTATPATPIPYGFTAAAIHNAQEAFAKGHAQGVALAAAEGIPLPEDIDLRKLSVEQLNRIRDNGHLNAAAKLRVDCALAVRPSATATSAPTTPQASPTSGEWPSLEQIQRDWENDRDGCRDAFKVFNAYRGFRESAALAAGMALPASDEDKIRDDWEADRDGCKDKFKVFGAYLGYRRSIKR